MKKFLLSVAALAASAMTVNAGLPLGIFDHVGVGLGVGTTGITIEAATPITHWVQMRAGVSIMPGINFNVNSDLDITGTREVAGQVYSKTYNGEVDVNGNLKRVQGQVIFNVYPIPMASLYVAAGAYFGGGTLLDLKAHTDLMQQVIDDGYVPEGNLEVGNYNIPVSREGNIKGGICVNGFRPYLGIGWGRAVPGKLVNFQVELGVQFHGTPKLYYYADPVNMVDRTYPDLNALLDDDDTFQKIMDKVKVYPNLMFRVNFRAY